MTSTHAPSTPVRLVLPMPAGDGATCLHVDAEGRIHDRRVLAPYQHEPRQPPVAPDADTTRNVLALPGSEVRSQWLELPARSEAQALAAARLMLDDRLAGSSRDLHLVVAAKTGDTDLRQVLVVESATLQARLDQARRLGFEADIALPDYMLLPSSGPDDPPCVAVRDGQWLVRGGRTAFTCEPGLAECVLSTSTLGDAAPVPIDDTAAVEAQLAHGALQPPVNLLQHRFARDSGHPEGRAAWRRMAILAGLLLLSPLLLTGADAIRYTIAAAGLRAEAGDIAGELAGASVNGDAPSLALQDALIRESAADAFPRLGSRLFRAIADIPGMQLEQLHFEGDDSLQAVLSHDAPDALDTLRQRLADDGLRLETRGTGDARGNDTAGNRASTVIVTGASSVEGAP